MIHTIHIIAFLLDLAVTKLGISKGYEEGNFFFRSETGGLIPENTIMIIVLPVLLINLFKVLEKQAKRSYSKAVFRILQLLIAVFFTYSHIFASYQWFLLLFGDWLLIPTALLLSALVLYGLKTFKNKIKIENFIYFLMLNILLLVWSEYIFYLTRSSIANNLTYLIPATLGTLMVWLEDRINL